MAAVPDPQSTAPAIGAFRTKATETGTYEEDLKRFMVHFIEKSMGKRNDFEEIWDEVLENYLVTFPRKGIRLKFNRGSLGKVLASSRDRSKLKDPETHQIIESLAAQGIGLVFGVRDYLKALPLNGQMDRARQLSRIQMGVLEAQGNFRTMYELLKDSFIFGTSIFEVGWEQRQRRQLVIEPAIDETLGIVTGRRTVPRDVIYRDRPLIRPVDIYDFYPDATGTRIQENMLGCAKRFRITKREIEGLWRAGTYNNAAGVRRLLDRLRFGQPNQRTSSSTGQQGGDTRFEQYETVSEHGVLVGFEYWGTIPFASPDGARNRVVTVIAGEIVRDSMNPYINGRIPFKEIVMNPVSGRFYGLSPAEVIRYLQDSTDNFFMVMNDAADLAIRTPLLVGQAWTGDMNALRRRAPNALIECRNPDAVKPLDVDLSALSFAAAELARRKQTMREAGGATNPMQAIPSGDRTTATEINTLTQLASQRVDMMMQLVEREDLPTLALLLHERLKQFIPPEGMIATVQDEAIPFSYDDIDLEAEFSFVGTRHSTGKQQKIQNLTLAMQTLASEPKLMFLVPELVVRLLRDGLEIDDAEKIMQQAAQRFQQLQEQEAEQEAASAGQ